MVEKALIIDDNEVSCVLLSELLKKYGIYSKMIGSGKEALMLENIEQFDIIFTDYLMPEMDGIEVAGKIKEITAPYGKEIPVILCTGNPQEVQEKLRQISGVSAILKKPVEKMVLEQVLNNYVSSWEYDNSEQEKEVIEGDWAKIQIPGFDTRYAIELSGDIATYKEILKEYAKIIKVKAEKIENCAKESDLQGYKLEVHALKSTSRLVGALELSKLCEGLEKKAEENKVKEVKEETEKLLSLYRGQMELLASFMPGKKEKKQRNRITKEKRRELLQNLKIALEDYDIDVAEAIMDQIEEYQWEDNDQAEFEKLKESIDNIDYFQGIEIINRIG